MSTPYIASTLRIPSPSIPLRHTHPPPPWPLLLLSHPHDAVRLELRALFRALSSLHGAPRLRPAHLRALFAWYSALEAFAVALLKAEEETLYPWIEQWGRIEGPLSTSERSRARGRIIRHVRDLSSLAAAVPTEEKETQTEKEGGGEVGEKTAGETARNGAKERSRDGEGKGRSSASMLRMRVSDAPKLWRKKGKEVGEEDVVREEAVLARAAERASMASSRGLGGHHDASYYLPLGGGALVQVAGGGRGAGGKAREGAAIGIEGECRTVLETVQKHARLLTRAMLSYFECEERYLPPVIDALYDASDVESDGIERGVWRAVVRNNRRGEAAVLMMRACGGTEKATKWAAAALSPLDRLQLPLWRRRMASGRGKLMATLLAVSPPEMGGVGNGGKTPVEEERTRRALLFIGGQGGGGRWGERADPSDAENGVDVRRAVSALSSSSASGRFGSGRLDGIGAFGGGGGRGGDVGSGKLNWSGRLGGRRRMQSRHGGDENGLKHQLGGDGLALPPGLGRATSSALAMPSPPASPTDAPSAKELLHQLGSQPAHWDGTSEEASDSEPSSSLLSAFQGANRFQAPTAASSRSVSWELRAQMGREGRKVEWDGTESDEEEESGSGDPASEEGGSGKGATCDDPPLAYEPVFERCAALRS